MASLPKSASVDESIPPQFNDPDDIAFHPLKPIEISLSSPCLQEPLFNPMSQFMHWYSHADWSIHKALAELQRYHGPTAESEELRILLVEVLTFCEDCLLHELPTNIYNIWKAEHAAIDRKIAAQDSRARRSRNTRQKRISVAR
jgi:hypothetical protein